MAAYSVCPICASPDQEGLTPRAALDASPIVRCKSCSFIYRRSPAAPVGMRPAREIPADALPDTVPDDVLAQRLALVEFSVLRGDLLDIGCGAGEFLRVAQQAGWRVAGIEQSAAVHQAQRHLGDGIVRDALTEGLWPAGSFDAVTLWGTLERSLQPVDLLRVAAHYCRIDGVLVVQIGAMAERFDPETFHYLFSPIALQRFLGRFGFRIERLEKKTHLQTRPLPRLWSPTPHQDEPAKSSGHTLSRSMRRALAPYHDEQLIAVARYVP